MVLDRPYLTCIVKVVIMIGTGSPPVVYPEGGGGGPAHSVGMHSTGSVQQESSSCTAARPGRVWDSASSASAADAGFSDLKRRTGTLCAVRTLRGFSPDSDSRYEVREEVSGLCSSSPVDLSNRKAKEFQPTRRAALMDAGSNVCWATDANDMNEHM